MAKLLATDETLLKVNASLEKIAGYVGAMALDDVNTVISDPERFHRLIQSGLAPDILSVGDQLIVPHTDYTNIVFDIIGFDHDVDATGLNEHSITVQAHIAIDKLMFDNGEKEAATEEIFDADLAYYVGDSSLESGYRLLVAGTDYTVGAAIPTGTTYYHTKVADSSGWVIKAGYNNWEHSAIRQWLNSEAAANAWWRAKHVGDVAPTYAATKDGFLKGLDADFKSLIGTTKKVTALNTRSDGGGSVELVEKIFLLSTTEVSGGKNNNIAEGEAYDYYTRLVGAVTTAENIGRIKYGTDGAACYWWLRDPLAGSAYAPRSVSPSGNVHYYYGGASTSNGVAPACILL